MEAADIDEKRLKHVEAVIQCGASGAAVITAIAESADPAEAARGLARKLRRAWSEATRPALGTR